MSNKQIKQLNEENTIEAADVFIVQRATSNLTVKVRADSILPDITVISEKLKTTIAFKATLSTGQAGLATSTWHKVALDTTVYDHNGDFDVANNWFVAPYKGVYHFDWCTSIGAASQRALTSLKLNNTDYVLRSHDQDSARNAQPHGSGDLQLDANDTIHVEIWQDTGTTTVATGSNDVTWFTGHLIGRVE